MREGRAMTTTTFLPVVVLVVNSRSRFVIVAPSDNGATIVFVFVFVLAIRVAAVIVSSWLDGGVPVNIIGKFSDTIER